MNSKTRLINESTLNTNLNELAHSLIRELTMACRKMAIYGANHPTARRAVEKPFFAFNDVFRFKKFVNINISRGHLFAMNIRLRESVFTEEIIKYMQMLEIEALLFERRMTMTELSRFLDRFVKRVSRTDYSNLLSAYLKQNKIDTIEVNSPRALKLFEDGRQYRGDIEGDYSVKTIAMQQLGDDLNRLADIAGGDDTVYETRGIDFAPEVVTYLLPEKVAAIAPDKLRNTLSAMFNELTGNDIEDKTVKQVTDRYQSLWKLLDYHPDRPAIVEGLQSSIKDDRVLADVVDKAGDTVTAIRLESSGHVDHILTRCFENENVECDPEEFGDAFQRLLRTGQYGKAIEIIDSLLGYLNSSDTGKRGHALGFLLSVVRIIDLSTDKTVFENILDKVTLVLEKHEETYEYSEFVWRLWEKCLVVGRFDLIVRLATAIGKAHKSVDNVIVYESVAVKKILDYVNRSEVISMMIDELMRGDRQTGVHIQNIFIAIGGEEVALGLSNIISHPDRHVRQQALKILAELGKASLKVCSRILVDDSMFERENGRYELSDAKWYVIRNAIFIIGKLKDPEGIMPLRLRINDKDVRVRREIIAALEKIGGEDACDMLILMTDDSVKEIRESAMIAVGLIGNADTAPMVIDVMTRNPQIVLRGTVALGNLGGEISREYLSRLLENRDELEKLAGNYVSKDELRLAIIKALGAIGDEHAIEKIKEFKDNMPATQKIFFKNSPINKVVSEILSRK